ncbi:MAG TPA: hypothetical protein VH350_11960 [Candidatus Sulfotelmatobacter sp.]|nr:hypothetical protein [Candidatus Sulfotelmatobacter sp.]
MAVPKRFPPLRLAVLNISVPIFLAIAAFASPTVVVISPQSGGSPGSPIFYEAYATSANCAGGISAMRIYTAPGVNAFTTNGAHVEHFITLAPGSYSTVVQAWDNCGGVAKVTVDLTVGSTAGVSMFLPNQPSAEWPVHVAASAQSPSCSGGISALRIYTASGVTPYTIDSNMLDAYVNLVPGNYNFTVQAWDNCGHIFKSQFAENVTTGSDAYLYGAANLKQANEFGIVELGITSNGTLTNPNGSGNAPIFAPQSAPNTVTVDPGGWFVYASSNVGIYGFQINRSNGALSPIPGSPFPLNQTLGDQGPPSIVMDPAGNFIYLVYGGGSAVDGLATYRIHRSSGALTWTGWARTFGNLSSGCASVTGATTNFTGQFVYVNALPNNCTNLETYGFRADPNRGFLNTQVPGSPYSVDTNASFGTVPVSTGRYLYLSNENGVTFGFSLVPGTGALTQVTGSPFPTASIFRLFADWKTRVLWAWEASLLQVLTIDPASGALSGGSAFGQSLNSLVEDHTAHFVFISYFGVPDVSAWAVSSSGTLTRLNMLTISSSTGSVGSIAVTRKNPI